jgi:hypothetical protein
MAVSLFSKSFYSCQTASRLLSQAKDEPLGLVQRARLHVHLYRCTRCTNYERQLQVLRELMSSFAKE